MEIISMERNCMGTMDFTLKIGKMRKAEEFCTYPIQKNDKGRTIFLQSDHRWAQLNMDTGEILLSARRAQYANIAWLMVCLVYGTAEKDTATPEQLAEMLNAIRGTAGEKVGNNYMGVFCDNSNAALV